MYQDIQLLETAALDQIMEWVVHHSTPMTIYCLGYQKQTRAKHTAFYEAAPFKEHHHFFLLVITSKPSAMTATNLANILELAIQLMPTGESEFLDEVRVLLDEDTEDEAEQQLVYNFSSVRIINDVALQA
ncbi:MAG: hypothetical protein PSV16_11065 [Flavobacterium sp.]|nr:hypothetical protein [Flavobacterium sp.]